MKTPIKILIIDDHPMVIGGYQKALVNQDRFQLSFVSANDCEEAINQLTISKNQEIFDLVFVDIQIPASKNGEYTSGEDIALYIAKHHKETKIIISTMIESADRIKNLIRVTPHHGILIKNEVNKSILIKAFFTVLEGEIFYSKSVLKVSKRIIQPDEVLDEKDIKIIYHLSRGVRMKQISNYISLSISAIEKRKKVIKECFEVNTNEELLKEAKKRGYL